MTPREELSAGAQRVPEPTGSPLLSFDLAAELEHLRTEDHPWQAGRNAKILVKYPNFRILLIGLRPGAHIAEHHAAGPISIQYGMRGVPETYFIAPDGRLVRKWNTLTAADLEQFLGELQRASTARVS